MGLEPGLIQDQSEQLRAQPLETASDVSGLILTPPLSGTQEQRLKDYLSKHP